MKILFLYILVYAAGRGFGGTWKTYLTVFAFAALFGIINPIEHGKYVYAALSPYLPHEYQAEKPKPQINDTTLEAQADNAALKHGIDPKLFRALITQESAWKPDAVSPVGAAGLTQLMAATAKEHCGLEADERFHPAKNLDCGASYFAAQLRRFGNVELALAAYNSGPDRVAKLGRVPRIRETQNYVSNIMASWGG